MINLKTNDLILYDHLVNAMHTNAAYESKEFLVNVIHQEKEEAEKLTGSPRQTTDALELLSNPVIFMRKWIGEVKKKQNYS